MTANVPRTTSQTARLMNSPPGYAPGWQEAVKIASPAAGSEWSHTVDGRYFERLVAVRFTLTTSATAGNRYPAVTLTNSDGDVVTTSPAGGAVAASTTLYANLTTSTPQSAGATAGNAYGFIPVLLIPPGWKWSSDTGALDAGDSYSAVVLLLHRFPTDMIRMPAAG